MQRVLLMSDKNLWFGYLKAGDKSSLVVRDQRVDPGKKQTLYLYNHLRGEMVEYRREIIEDKLRDAKPDEYDAAELRKAYLKALKRAKPNTYQILFAPGSRAPSKKAPVPSPKESDEGDIDTDIETDIDGDIEVGDDFFAAGDI